MSLDSVVPQTFPRYESACRQWCLFCLRFVLTDGTKHDSWLYGQDIIKDERLLMDFIAYESIMSNEGMGWTARTMRNKLAAIRFRHIHSHLPDTTTGNPHIKSC